MIEIFCGNGGVGKTTLSYSRALFLARSGFKTLILTIDPSKRLKEFVQINKEQNLSVEIFDAEEVFQNLLESKGTEENRLLKILMSNMAGMNEILSLVYLQMVIKKSDYQRIVLDTPPGQHFIDFIENGMKLDKFFNKRIEQVISVISRPNKTVTFLARFIDQGVSKVIDSLNKVTGQNFVSEFLNALQIIFQLKDEFKEAAELSNKLVNDNLSTWYFVYSSKHYNLEDLTGMLSKIKQKNTLGVMNRSMLKDIQQLLNLENLNQTEKNYLLSYQEIEATVVKKINPLFKTNLIFPEVNSSKLKEQIEMLTNHWKENIE
jgi:anion-transporting  ArsA/GET3 family ATPase